MLTRIRRHTVSIKHALEGIIYTFKTQPNFRFHTIAAISVIMAGIYFEISYFEWLVILFTFNMVLVAEMLNTSIESMVDLITLERKPEAKVAKDVAAGMVLISALCAIAIGLYIFLPKFFSL